MSQTVALLVDSYRDLNSRKLFWITLALSGLVVLAFLAMGIDANGITIFGLPVKGTPISTDVISPATFYKALFLALGVKIWLTFVAAILALVSTGGMFPDLLTGGSIDLYLSKPISRLRIFITKYLTGLLFAAMQVAVFSAASFIVLGFRAKVWLPGVFWAVPTVLAFYSYLYCICVLVGVLTRSAAASILMTVLFMFGVWGVHVTEANILLVSQMKNEIVARRLTARLANTTRELRKTEAMDPGVLRDSRLSYYRKRIDSDAAQQRTNSEDGHWLKTWHDRAYWCAAALPKAQETVDLMQRRLLSAAELQSPDADSRDAEQEPRMLMFGRTTDDDFAKAKAQDVLRKRSLKWVLGTSLLFELAVVSLAGWVFCRRDY